MLTFLRKIRRSLIASGATGRYLLYALGEIALVVIGILIALKINNWNEDRKRTSLEIETLQELLETVEYNLASVKIQITYHEESIAKTKSLLNHLQSDLPYADSLEELFYYPYRGVGIYLNNSGYNLLENRGIDILSNTELRKSIVKHFTVDMDFVKELSRSEQVRLDEFRIYYQTLVGQRINDQFIGFSGRPIPKTYPFDYESLKSDTAFHRQLLWKITRRTQVLDRMQDRSVNTNVKLIKEINQELEKLR